MSDNWFLLDEKKDVFQPFYEIKLKTSKFKELAI